MRMETLCFFAPLVCLSDNDPGSINIEATNILLVEDNSWRSGEEFWV